MSEFESLVHRVQRQGFEHPSKEAIVSGASRVSYGELSRRIASVAGFLRARGVERGDRVAVLLENSPEYVAAYYGALAGGCMAVGMNAACRWREVKSVLEHSGAKILVVDERHPDFARVLSEQAHESLIVSLQGEASGTVPWNEVLSGEPVDPVRVGSDTNAAIVYTSGTTGRPKGVVLTHGNLSANAAAIIEYLELSAVDRVLNLLPFSYSYGASVLHTHLACGATLVLENHFVYPRTVLARVAEEQITGLPGVPSTFSRLLECDLGECDLTSLRYLTQAGGAMSTQNILRIRQAVPRARLFVMYGQTEATARLTYLSPESLVDKLGSVGRPVAGVLIEVRGDREERLPAGEIGQIYARGPNVMSGYYRDDEATGMVLKDGWLCTGDLGYIDVDGYLYLTGRLSDMIKSAGHRISPAEIEDVIAELPQVGEVAVIGTPDDRLGQAIKAFVRVSPGNVLDALTIQRYCKEHLPSYKIPRTIEFTEQLPRTPSGKIMRHMLSTVGTLS